jgi:N-hydroxyarylamine O-acetyltransferase
MDIDFYLQRIRYSGPRVPDARVLRDLHLAHLQSVPFENLDIHLGRLILIDEDAFYAKIVRERRGGFCYELNGLFAALLRALGFRVTLLSARVYSGSVPGPEYDHLALVVDLEERWLADVGFGDSFIEPLRLDAPGEQVQSGVRYRIDARGETRRLMVARPDAGESPLYEFSLTPRRIEEFAEMCRWQQTSPESHFTQKRVCSLATPSGRLTLSDNRFIVTESGVRREEAVESDAAYAAFLRVYFGIDLGRVPRWTLQDLPP